jgi:hypothetical protein
VAFAGAATECSTCKAWWHLTSGARPTDLSSEPGARGQIILTAINLGDADVNGAVTPVTILDKLPAGLRATAIEAISGIKGVALQYESDGPVTCVKSTLTCVFAGILPPYDQLEVRIKVETLKDAASGESNEFGVSGGGAPAAAVSRALTFGEEPTPFGVEDYGLGYEEPGGAPATQAGGHPFQQTVTLALNQAPATISKTGYEPNSAGMTKDVAVKLPQGLLGNPSPFPRCTIAQFVTQGIGSAQFQDLCPQQAAVGVAVISYFEPALTGYNTEAVPVFNLEPSFGEPARFGFLLPTTPVLIDTSLRSGPGEDYGVTATTTNITQTVSFISSKIVFWGVPGDPRHDGSRGWSCLESSRGKTGGASCVPSGEAHPPSLLTLPTSCAGPLQSSLAVDSWADPTDVLSVPTSEPLPALGGCNRLSFSPTIGAEPSTDRASAPSGLDFNLGFHDEGLTSAEGTAQSQLKNVSVVLPEGLTINPSAGVGLGGCSEADFARESVSSLPGEGCPNDSKLGTVEIETPLLTQKIHGSLFIAQPHENPFSSLVAIYIVAKNPETGVLIKLAGKVTPNPVTGQLVTTFENNPQLPFDRFNFHFREGQQAPLISPPACGTYTTTAQLTSWSEPMTALTETSSFTITKGFDGGACPSGGVPPFHPAIQSGTLNNNAGAFTPFYLHLTRTDGEQEITGFSTDLPSGLTGDLSGIPFCSEAAIALARSKSGAQEEAAPSCPASSQIGHTLVGTGVGAVLAYVPGKIYFAGPYNGDPFSIVSVTSAVVGPFDLGTVVLRFGLRIDPNTAQVSVDPSASEPIPHIIQGIVTHVRDIRVYIDRANFILDPTSCNPLAISSTLSSNQGQSTTISSPFQASNCANLGFKPSFKVSTSGKTSRAKGASLTVKLAYPKAPLGSQANIRSVKVNLPKQLPSRLTTLQKACTDRVFNANPAACPSASIVGHAQAITPILPEPLIGPAYFVSHGGAKFPELIVVLQGYGVTIDLHGETFISKAGITSSTFRTVPDQPVTSFELTLPEGPFSALAANGDLCKSTLKMPTAFTAQNGATIKQNTPVSVTGCPKHRKLKKAKRASRHDGKATTRK